MRTNREMRREYISHVASEGHPSQTVHGQGAGRQVRKVARTETSFQLDSRIPPGHNTLLFQLTCSPGPALPEGWGSEPGPKRPGPSLPQPQKSYSVSHSPFPGLVGPGIGARLSHRGRGNPYLLLLPLSWLTIPLSP